MNELCNEFCESDDDNTVELNIPNNLPWIEKYRPVTLDEIISQDKIINTLKLFIKNECLPHILFYGPPGTGKTSTIMACARQLYGENTKFMVLELNASEDRGIEIVRTKIKQFVTAQNVFLGQGTENKDKLFKLVILDETDAMTDDAQAILRKIVENYTQHTRFCLICNYIQKINPALQSRCTRFRFNPVDDTIIRKKIIQVAKNENVKLVKSGTDTLIKHGKGDMRKIFNILQSVSMSYDKVNDENINNSIGYPQKTRVIEICNSLINESFFESYNKIILIKYKDGLSLNDIIQEIHNIILKYILNKKTYGTSINIFTNDQLIHILDKLREIEYNQATNTTENIQVSALVGIFKLLNTQKN